MNRKIKKTVPDISYFRLSLMDFLKESHPERLKEDRLIVACTEAATDAYERAIRGGDNPFEATGQANVVLFNGFCFSKHNTLVNILWNEFSNEVAEDGAKSFAIELLPHCELGFYAISPVRRLCIRV